MGVLIASVIESRCKLAGGWGAGVRVRSLSGDRFEGEGGGGGGSAGGHLMSSQAEPSIVRVTTFETPKPNDMEPAK